MRRRRKTGLAAGFAAALLGPVLAAVIRRRAEGPASMPPAVVPSGWDWCEVCGEPATHEIREAYANDGEMAGWSGGTSCSATYCDDHAPAGAVALRS